MVEEVSGDEVEETVKVEDGQVQYASLKVVVNAVSETSSQMILKELRRLLSTKEVNERIRNGIMPYIYAAGFLSFAGREISRENIVKLMSAIGLYVDNDIIGVLERCGIRSHLIYVYAFYFLMANGVSPTIKDMMNVAESTGMMGDESTASEVLEACAGE